MGRQSQRKSEARERSGPTGRPASSRGGQGLAVATLVAVVGVLVISLANWREIDGIEAKLDTRLGELETRLTQVSAKVDELPKQAAQPAPRRGPDPDRVYAINTAGAPSKGPANAPITIAEFSDFQ